MSETYREIKEQFDSMKRTAAYLEQITLPNLLNGKLAVVGCGSSYSLAKSFAAIAGMREGCASRAIAGGDLLLHAERYAASLNGATIVAVSRSGSTSEILLATERLKKLGCEFTLVSLVCVQDSALSRASATAIELPWAFDRSVCQTRTVSCLYFAFAYMVAKETGDAALLAELNLIAERGDSFLDKIEPLAKEIAALPWETAVVLGDAEIAGLCEEGALAFKEICQLPSNHYHVLDTRHGPMVLFNEKTLIIAAVSGSEFEAGFISDMAKKNAVIAAVSAQSETENARSVVFGYPLSHTALGLPALLFCQLVSYFKSFHSGANPDAPDGLDAWIKL